MSRWMRTRDTREIIAIIPLHVLLFLGGGCSPYYSSKGDEFNAGPVDAANFPKPYQGAGNTTGPYGYVAGQGVFSEINAYVNGGVAGYYSFPFTKNGVSSGSTAGQLDPGGEPLRLLEDGQPYSRVPTPVAYVFDSTPPTNPFPPSPLCSPPPNYSYDPDNDTEGVRLDYQGNIFTRLPLATQDPGRASTWTYVPIVREISVSAAGRPCQAFKSEDRLRKTLGNLPPAGTNYLLWAIIDPSAGVYRLGEVGWGQGGTGFSRYLVDGGRNPAWSRGLGVQKWGWFGQYYLAYIDGGYIPTRSLTVSGKQVVQMVTQRLYIPRTQVRTSSTSSSVDPNIGQGYDVLQYRRSDPGYSPVCEVWTYPVSTNPPPITSTLPKSEGEILSSALGPPSLGPPDRSAIPPYVFCPQAS